MIHTFFQINDGFAHSGFDLGQEYLEQGLLPNTLSLLLTYMLLASAVAMYFAFGISFLMESRESEANNIGQKQYFRGLGLFIIAVAFAQVTTIVDWASMDVFNKTFFQTAEDYNPPFKSIIGGDDYVMNFTIILFALIFLVYPLEKYLLGKKVYLTIIVIAVTPFPAIIRILEINAYTYGFDLSTDGFEKSIFLILWMFVILIVALSVLFVMKLYLDIGIKAPEGSILRRRSRMVITGLVIWIICLFITSNIMSEISNVLSEFGPNTAVTVGTWPYLIKGMGLYPLFPLIIPSLLLTALALLVRGFKREWA